MGNGSQFGHPVALEFAFHLWWVDYIDFPVSDCVTWSWSSYYPCTLRLNPLEAVTTPECSECCAKFRPVRFRFYALVSLRISTAALVLLAQTRFNTLPERSPSMDRTLRLLASFLLLVVFCSAERQRVYYIGIVEDLWDYAPSGKNLLNGKDIADDEWVRMWCFCKMCLFLKVCCCQMMPCESVELNTNYSKTAFRKFSVILRGCDRVYRRPLKNAVYQQAIRASCGWFKG